MIYGVIMWRLAQQNARLLLIDEEEGMVLVDYDGGRGDVSEREVEHVDVEGSDAGKMAAEEIRELVTKAVKELKKWDKEVGKRVEFVLSELNAE